MGVYDPLGTYLQRSGSTRVPMTFAQVEAVAGHKLPRSAYRHRPWWANEERGHSHAKAWLRAGYETEQVDMAGKKLVFRRMSEERPRGMSQDSRVFADAQKKLGRHPAIGALKGTFTIAPEYDLTSPIYTDEEWAEVEKEMEEDWGAIEGDVSGRKE